MDVPNLISEAKVSPRWKINKEDIDKWLLGLRDFLVPLSFIYVMQVFASVQNGPLSLNDLIPTQLTVGAIELYILNAIVGLYRKFQDGKKQ